MIIPDFLLLTNDDGFDASGIAALEYAFACRGVPASVCTPLHEKSGSGHSITLNDPLRLHTFGERRFAVTGSPADAVYLALGGIVSPRPELIVSGINRGANLANDMTYSGTVAAAMEGFYHGIASVAVSLYGTPGTVFERPLFDKAAELLLDRVFPFIADALGREWYKTPRIFNINIPDSALADLSVSPEIRWTRLGRRLYGNEIFKRQDPRGRDYYWIGGNQHTFAEIADSDCIAMRDGAVSITPLTLSLTDESLLTQLREIAP